MVCFLERIQETFSQADGPAMGWIVHHQTKLIESVVKEVCNERLADLIATYQIPVPSSFITFQDVVVQFAQRVPSITLEKVEVYVVESTCLTCLKPGHIARDCMQQREPPMCYRCNAVGHVATKCRVRDVYCQICKNIRQV